MTTKFVTMSSSTLKWKIAKLKFAGVIFLSLMMFALLASASLI